MDLKALMQKLEQIDKKQNLMEAEEKRAPAKKSERDVELPSGAKIKATKVQGWQSQKADKESDKEKRKDESLGSIAQALLQEFGLEEKVTLPADGSAPKTQQVQVPGAGTVTQNAPAGAEEFKFSPEQEKWLGGANRQDPNILARMPGPKPPVSYFKDPADQEIAKKMNFGQANLNKLKSLAGMKPGDAQTFADPQASTTRSAGGAAGAAAGGAAAATKPAAGGAAAPAGTPPGSVDDEGNLMPGYTTDENGNVVKAGDPNFVEPATQKLAQQGRQAAKEKEFAANADAEDQAMGQAMAANAAGGPSSVNAQGQNVTMPDGTNPETGGKTQTATAAGGAAAPAGGAAAAKPAAGGADPKVQNVQKQLAALGIDIGKSGADGKMGPATAGGIKAFEKMAGKPETGKVTPELEQLLAKGAQIKSQNDLVASIGSLEKILSKYKVESITSPDDIDALTEAELFSYVMKNINLLSEAEKMQAIRISLDEGSFSQMVGAEKDIQRNIASQQKAADMSARWAANKAAPAAAPAAAPKAAGGAMDKLKAFGKNLATRVTGAGGGAKGVAKAGAKMGARLIPGIGWGLLAWDVIGAAMDALKTDPAVPMDPADKAELDKHAAVLKKYLEDAEAASGLPKDLQQRLTNVHARMQKLASGGAKAPAAPQAAGAAAGDMMAQATAGQLGA